MSWQTIALESVLYSVGIYAVLMGIVAKDGVISQIHNYPKPIFDRALELGLVTPEEVRRNKLHYKAVGALVMIVVPLVLILVVNRARTFWDGFWQAYILFNAWSWFDALVVDCIFFCHSPRWVIPGTEDLVDSYHDYWFHIKYAVYGLAFIAVPAALVGALAAALG